ncbi:MAG: RnfABCDGE type electron transport complex subunit C [Oscillospiraceae bacterium]|nr:RnfABCDGE type electron transport complex subunit C [Oscillospiraceae bacterium]
MKNSIFVREALPPEKEYVLDYVHTLYEPAGDMIFPLSQRSGVTCRPLVAVGDPVLAGQQLSECAENPALGAWSSCSGTVKAIERRPTRTGEAECIVVENDRKFRTAEGVGVRTDWMELGRAEILRRIREAGAAGSAAARYPTSARLDSLAPGTVSRVVIDGSEWEPLISSDDDILRTFAHGVVTGLRILLRLFPGAEGAILIGEDKQRALDTVWDAAEDAAGIQVVAVSAGRPLGGEAMIDRLLAWNNNSYTSERACCLVETPAGANAICEAVCSGTPFFRRVVTVAGSAVARPGNYLVRVGTSCAELLAAAGGTRPGAEIKKAVMGGPITGLSLSTLDVPVQKDTGALLLLAEDGEESAREAMTECIRCGRCARACPAGLMPMLMLKAAEKCDQKEYARLHGAECISCGVCTWTCPAKQPLSQLFAYMGALIKK